MAEFASNAKGNAALTTGIIGASGVGLALLNGMGGLFGNNNCCSDDHVVTRYEAKKDAEIASLGNENALLKSNIFTDQKISDVFERVSTRIRGLENLVNENTCGQAVINQQVSDNIKFVDSKFDTVYRDIKTGDEAVKCYVDCHFVPGKLIMPLDSICPPAAPLCPEPPAAKK